MTDEELYVGELEARIIELEEKTLLLTAQKDGAYRERNQLVALISKIFPAWLGRHPAKEEWEDDWRWIVFIVLPTGQTSWHAHDSELHLFDHLLREPLGFPEWDGHSTAEKYERIAAVIPSSALLSKFGEAYRRMLEAKGEVDSRSRDTCPCGYGGKAGHGEGWCALGRIPGYQP